MKTVVHLTAPGAFGGLESVVEGLATATASHGLRVVVGAVLNEGTRAPDWLSQLSGRNVHVELAFLPARAYLHERRVVREWLEKHRPSIVHTHGYRADVLHTGIARSLGIPQISTAHGFASTGAKGRLFEWLQLRAWRKTDAVVAVSRPLVEVLARAGVARNRIVCIRNGLIAMNRPSLDRASARRSLGLSENDPVVGWTGRLSGEKAPELMIRALGLSANARLQLCLIGGGPLMEACRALGSQLVLGDRLRLAGFLPNASAYFAAFDVLALSSLTEGTPMVVLEAIAARIPVVATAVGGVPDLLRDGGGWLVTPGSAEELARAVDAAVASPSEAAQRAETAITRLHDAGQEDDWIQDYLALYARLARRD